MNSRKRVLSAIHHQEADLVPFDLGGTENTTIARQAYIHLRAFLDLPVDPEPYVINRQMDVVFAQDDLLKSLGIDIKGIRPSSVYQPNWREMEDDSFYDELNIRWRKASYYYDMVEHPMRDFNIDDIRKFNWPDPRAAGRMAGLREQARHLYETTDYALVGGHIMWGPFELGCALRGYSQFLMDFYQNESFAMALLEKNLEVAIGFWDAYLDEVGEFVQVVAQGDDLGMQTGPIISPKMYRKYIKPLHKRLFDFIHTKTKAKIFLHSCGSIYSIIPDFIESGVEILSPVQFTAAKMDLIQLKKEFGKDLTFWGGGVDTQHVLPVGTLKEIRDQVSKNFDIMAPGGGFVFVPVHNIQSDISPERIMAVYDTALSCRKYAV